MKAACTAAERGHRVTLVEKQSDPGGQLLLNARIPGRGEMVTAAKDLISTLENLDAEVEVGREVDKRYIEEMAPDVLVLATGARPIIPEIEGIENKEVVLAWDVLSGMASVGREVVIVGGNAVGLETALYLANQGTISPEVLHFLVANRAETAETLAELVNKGSKKITVVEMLKKAGRDIGSSTRWTVMAELRRLGVTVMTSARVVKIADGGVRIEKEKGEDFLTADSVVIAAGAESEDALLRAAGNAVSEIYTIGDAKEPRNALEAIREGFLAGSMI